MTTITTTRQFDYNAFNLNAILVGATNAVFQDNQNVTFNGITYSDLYLVQWSDGVEDLGSAFLGSGFAVNSSNILTSGNVTGFAEAHWNGSAYAAHLYIEGLTVGAVALYNAATTVTTTDDFALLNGELAGDDIFYLSAFADIALGLGGHDEMNGEAGHDTLAGGSGDDTLRGGQGADQLTGGSGDDEIDGGDGTGDRAMYLGTAAVTVNLGLTTAQATGQGVDTLIRVEHLTSGSGADRLTGSGAANNLTGNAGNDTLSGANGNDTLLGGGDIDRLFGGIGADRLVGGLGADVSSGGLGNDSFVFLTRLEGGDQITDFSNAAGNDDRFLLEGSAFGYGSATGTIAASHFISRADNLAQTADQHFILRTTDNTLWFDSNGDAAGGLTLLADLQAGAVVTANDLVLI